MTPDDYLENVKARHGAGAQAVAAIWIRSAALAEMSAHSKLDHADLTAVLKMNLMDVVRLTNISAEVFAEIVKESTELGNSPDVILH